MKLSICIPTYNRARVLDDCLGRLPLFDCEIVVSDNASGDDTATIVKKHMTYDRRIRYVCASENLGAIANWRRAVEASTGDVMIYLADDDSLVSEPLAALAGLFERRPELVGIYTDHACWDDAKGVELHRYGFPPGPREFDRQPVELVQFLLHTRLPPEIGLWRRDAWLAAAVPTSLALPFHVWCYRLGQLGTLRFDPTVFYREHWIQKPGLERTVQLNRDWALRYIGDEQRLGLEQIVRLAEVDSGLTFDRGPIRDAIDYMLLERTTLEVQRAAERGDYVLAVELRRRQQLWNWSAPIETDRALTAKAAEATGMSAEAFRI